MSIVGEIERARDVVQETFMPIRLAELVGGLDTAGALMGPVAAVGWGAFSLGAVASGRVSRRIGVARLHAT